MKDLSYYQNALKKREQQGLLRKCLHSDSAPGAEIELAGQKHIDFVTNNYLGLAGHPAMHEGIEEGMRRWGSGAAGSRLLGGSAGYHRDLEVWIETWKGTEAALLFNAGYMANVGIISAMVQPGMHVFSDRLNHASMIDGIQLSEAKLHRYNHLDLNHLEDLLKKYPAPGMIITESVFSMDGDVAPLREIANLAERYDQFLLVDEAHSEGIFGPDGKGLVHQWDLQEKVDLVMGTFGKAYGCFGAHVCTSSLLRLWLENHARSFIYATALPIQVVLSIRNALQISIEENWRREHVLKLSAQLRKDLTEDGWDILNSSTQIIPILMGTNERAIAATQFLEQRGIRTAPVREPTVPKGTARLRVNVTAAHDLEHIQKLRQALLEFRNS